MNKANINEQPSTTVPPKTLHRKRLIIGSVLIGAALLGGIISLVWYFWDQSKLPAGYSESIAKVVRSKGQSAEHSQKTIKQSVGIINAIRNNLRIFIPSVILIILALTTLIVLNIVLSSDSTTEQLIATPEAQVKVVDEDVFSLGEIIGTLVLVVVILIAVIIGGKRLLDKRQIQQQDEAKRVLPVLRRLHSQRLAMKEDQKCKKVAEKTGKTLTVLYGSESVNVECPDNFSWNSIWWAIRVHAKTPEEVDTLNNSTLQALEKHISLLDHSKPDNSIKYDTNSFDTTSLHIAHQSACILTNVPPITPGVPFGPSPAGNETEDAQLLELEYAALVAFAKGTNGSCTVATTDSPQESITTLLMYVEALDMPKTTINLSCNPHPSSLAIFKSPDVQKEFGNEKYFTAFASSHNRWEAISLHLAKYNTIQKRFIVWSMYDAFQCKA